MEKEEVWVTKSNPIDWGRRPEESDRWFQSKEEFLNDFDHSEFKQMIVIRKCNGELKFRNFLKSITLDDPQIEIQGKDAFKMAHDSLKRTLDDREINIEIKKRKCCKCICKQEYRSKGEDKIIKLFSEEALRKRSTG